MTAPSPRRGAEVSALLLTVSTWARSDNNIRALVLVGSYARGVPRRDSDVDIVVITVDLSSYLDDDRWLDIVTPHAQTVREQQWGPVTERRRRLPSGLEVEIGITTPAWAALPLDPGTHRVLADGARCLHDPDRLILHAVAAAAGSYSTLPGDPTRG